MGQAAGECIMAIKEIPIPNTIIHNAPPPLVEVYGTHFEMGCQIGEACRDQVKHSVENGHAMILPVNGAPSRRGSRRHRVRIYLTYI